MQQIFLFSDNETNIHAHSDAFAEGVDACVAGISINQNPYVKIEIIDGERCWPTVLQDHIQAGEWVDGYISAPNYNT